MAEVKWDQAYPIAEAERSKFIPIDTSTITDYPSAGRGKHAVLTYNIGSDPGAPGADPLNPSYIQLVDDDGEAVTITENITDPYGGSVNALNVRIAESVTTLSAFQIDATGISGLDIQASIKYPNATYYKPVTINPASIATITFDRQVLVVEAFNRSQTNEVYLAFDNMDLGTLSAAGMPIDTESFYSIDRMTTNVYIGNASDETIDVRVVGHYRNH
jgi:hypothetical protein